TWMPRSTDAMLPGSPRTSCSSQLAHSTFTQVAPTHWTMLTPSSTGPRGAGVRVRLTEACQTSGNSYIFDRRHAAGVNQSHLGQPPSLEVITRAQSVPVRSPFVGETTMTTR